MADPKFLENLNIPGVGALVVSDANAVKGAGISAATAVQNNDTTVPTGKAVTTELNKKQNTLTAGTGLAFGTGADANKLGHSNSVTAESTSSLKKFTYDAQGHITGSSELSQAESDALASGINSTKVGQISTNQNNISMLTPTVKDSGSTFTVGSDYTLVEACTLTVPIPTSGVKCAHILAGLAFNSSAPRGIIISLSNDSSDFNANNRMLAKVESTDYIRLSAECFYYNYGGTAVNIYIWAKSNSSGTNRVVSSMQLLN